MKLTLVIFSSILLLTPTTSLAKSQTLITGQDAEEVQENAFKEHMDYPVGPLRCGQRCSQWWERS